MSRSAASVLLLLGSLVPWPAAAATWSLGAHLGFASIRGDALTAGSSTVFAWPSSAFTCEPGLRLGVGPTVPFANAGLGVNREGGAAKAGTSARFGAGVGVRHIVGNRHGVVRAEARVDRNTRDSTFGRPGLTSIGPRLGFDLWL